LWRAVRVVQRCIRETHGGATVELGVQDGADAGQSVPHVHVHVIPRAAAPATK
jgi:bis(5'-adenosyl)-triphosphatase